MALEAIVGGTFASVLDFIGSAAGTAAGTQPVKDWFSGCKTRLVAGWSLPGNHDLVRGIRTAHLCAVDRVAREHAKLIKQMPASEIGPDEQAFSRNIQDFLDHRLKVLTSSAIDHDVLTIEDIDHVLGHLVHPETAEGYAKQAATARNGAIARALQEIEADAGRPAPPLFVGLFQGDSGAGWYSAFALYVTEQLKTDERFRSIFLAAELVDIKRAMAALDSRVGDLLKQHPDLRPFVGDVKDRLVRIETKIDALPAALVAALESSGFIRRAEHDGLERRTILALARRLNPDESLDLDRAIIELENAVKIALDVIAKGERGTNHTAFVDEVLARIALQTKAGEFDKASREVDAALAELERREEELRNETQRSRIAVSAGAIIPH